jgi:hypothetical protein
MAEVEDTSKFFEEIDKEFDTLNSVTKKNKSTEYIQLLEFLKTNKEKIVSKCNTELALKSYVNLISKKMFGLNPAFKARGREISTVKVRSRREDLKEIFGDVIEFKDK